MKMEPPYTEFKEFVEKVWDYWMEEGKNRERLGEMIKRLGFRKLLEATELEPIPRMVKTPDQSLYFLRSGGSSRWLGTRYESIP